MKPIEIGRRVRPGKSANLMIRLDPASKQLVKRVAALRGVSASDYVRNLVVAGARRESIELERSAILLEPADQLAFWRALHEPVALTASQRSLGKLMRGKK